MPSYISSIGTAAPSFQVNKDEAVSFMTSALHLDEKAARQLKILYRASGIDTRYTVLNDYKTINGDFSFYPNTVDLEPFPTTSQRMQAFRKYALPLSINAINNCLEKIKMYPSSITHLIVVSCTGMYAPGLEIEIVEAMEMEKSVHRTAINFMGCYAAIIGLKTASAIVRSDKTANVLLVCTELCTLHFQKQNSEDFILANALFGDGSAAVLITPEPLSMISLELRNFYSDLASSGKEEMAWNIGNFGFEMKLSTYVPDMIRSGIRELTLNLLKSLNMHLSQLSYYAIHPGGKRILEVIEQELELSKKDNLYAYEVLRKYGNMSSVTVLFVLNELLYSLTQADDEKNILSFAFGPGLTMESMLLTVNAHV